MIQQFAASSKVHIVASDFFILDGQVFKNGRRSERENKARAPALICIPLHYTRTQCFYESREVVKRTSKRETQIILEISLSRVEAPRAFASIHSSRFDHAVALSP